MIKLILRIEDKSDVKNLSDTRISLEREFDASSTSERDMAFLLEDNIKRCIGGLQSRINSKN